MLPLYAKSIMANTPPRRPTTDALRAAAAFSDDALGVAAELVAEPEVEPVAREEEAEPVREVDALAPDDAEAPEVEALLAPEEDADADAEEDAPEAETVAMAAKSWDEVNVAQLEDAGTLGWYGMVEIAPRDSGGCE
jgi:hypothetical protein